MGQAKKLYMEQEEQEFSELEVIEFCKMLIERESIENPMLGIARQIRAQKSLTFLSQRQRETLESFIKMFKFKNKCRSCTDDNIADLLEYIEIQEDEEQLCPTCRLDKDIYMQD